MRIAQLVENLKIGGLEKIAVDLAVAQKQAGHTPFLYCVSTAGPLAEAAQAAGIVVREFRKEPGFSWNCVLQMAESLRTDRVEIVHTHNSVIHHYGLFAARKAGIRKVVNTRHGLGVLHTGRRQELYFRATMPWTSAVVMVCEDGRRFFTTHRGVPAHKAHVVLNGVPLEPFQNTYAQPGRDPNRIRFGTVGRMVSAKAHADLVEAFRIVSSQLPQAELHFIGEGPLLGNLRDLAAKYGLEQRIHFHGASLDIPRKLADLDVFVLSSISEGLPVVILEAMAAGLPIVSTRIGGVPEVAPEDVAWLSPPADPQALANNMLTAARSGQLAEKGANARSLAMKDYGVAVTQRKYEDLFRKLN